MRRRLTLAIVGLLAGSLLLAGAGALLVNRSSTRHDTQRQLRGEATSFAAAARTIRSPRVLEVAARVLRLDHGTLVTVTSGGALVTLTRSGALIATSKLPSGLAVSDLVPSALTGGQTVSGWQGTLAFVAMPIGLNPLVSAQLPPGATAVVVVTRRTGLLGSGWEFFLLASGVSLLIGAAIAAELSRRIARPVVDATTVARRIAGGELAARMAVPDGGGEEFASLASSINTMAANLEEARQRESRLLLSVSHDLRTPLTSIRGYAEAISDGAVDEPEVAAGIIITEARRLERLVADLLDLAKLDSDHLSLHLGATDLHHVANEMVTAAAPRALSRNIELSMAGAGQDDLLVVADPDRLAQVLANLLENSIDFGRRSVSVAVRSTSDYWAEVVVEDDGTGIPPGELVRVFDRFYQVDHGAAARGGSGLGLSIVSELVHAMGGSVRAESPIAHDGGTRMVLTLHRSDPARAPR